MPKPVELLLKNGETKTWASMKEAKAWARGVWSSESIVPREPFADEEVAMIVEAACRAHFAFESKINGRDIKHFTVAQVGHGVHRRSFAALLADETLEMFSFDACIAPKRPNFDSVVLAALREEVREQRDDWLEEHHPLHEGASKHDEIYTCALTGASMSRVEAEVDHEDPWSFDAIVRAWMAAENIKSLKSIAIRWTEMPAKRPLLRNIFVALRWREFHEQRARFRLVSRRAHHTRTAEQTREKKRQKLAE